MRIFEVLMDEKGRYSSNRFIGVLSGVSLCVCLIISALSHREITPHDGIIDAVVFVCASSLGFGMVNKVAEKMYGYDRPKDDRENKAASPEAKG